MRALPRSTPRQMISAARSGVVRRSASNSAAICSRVRPWPVGSFLTRALRAMLVWTPPGWTVTARTPVPRSSCRSASVKPRTANFDAQYALWYGMPSRPNTLEVFTITPSSCSTRRGRKARGLIFRAIAAPYRRGNPAAHHGPAALGRTGGDAARVPTLAAFARRLQHEVAEQGAQYHVHLHVREGGADAAPGAAAERDPLIGV